MMTCCNLPYACLFLSANVQATLVFCQRVNWLDGGDLKRIWRLGYTGRGHFNFVLGFNNNSDRKIDTE